MKNAVVTLTAAMLLSASAVFAQDSDAPATSPTAVGVEDLALGEEVKDPNAPGTTYIKAVEGDWEIRCIRVAEGQVEPCNLYQLLRDGEGNNVAEMSIFALPEGQKAAAGAQIITPLETLLTQQLTLKVDNGAGKRYPFTFCNRVGCYAQVGFTDQDVSAFRRGNAATLTIVPMGAPKDTTVDLTVSLTGFTAGFKNIQESTAAAVAARAAASE